MNYTVQKRVWRVLDALSGLLTLYSPVSLRIRAEDSLLKRGWSTNVVGVGAIIMFMYQPRLSVIMEMTVHIAKAYNLRKQNDMAKSI